MTDIFRRWPCFAAPFAQTLQENVKDRHEGDGQQGGGQHPSKDGCADGLLAGRAGPKGKEQRDHSQDEGKGSHDYGTEPSAGGLYGRLGDGQTIPMQIAGKLDDQDGVFAGQGDHQHQTDLGVDIVVKTADNESQQDPDQGHGHGQNHCRRRSPTLV